MISLENCTICQTTNELQLWYVCIDFQLVYKDCIFTTYNNDKLKKIYNEAVEGYGKDRVEVRSLSLIE